MAQWPCPRFVIVLTGLALLIVFVELGRMDVATANEGQRATPPAEMLRSGDFVVPTLNGQPYLAKPPLLYWTIAGVYKVTGVVSTWTARLPTAMCFVALVLSAYFIFRRWVSEGAARWGAMALLVCPYLLERARWANLDTPLTLATFLALAALFTAWQAEGRRRVGFTLAAGVALGAATLLKGPPPYLFVFGGLLAYAAIQASDGRAMARYGLIWTAVCFVLGFVLWPLPVQFPAALLVFVMGWIALCARYAGRALLSGAAVALGAVAVALALAAPWALAVLERFTWPEIQALIQGEVVQRTHTATAINSGSPVYYLLALPVMLAPWGLLLPLQAAPRLWTQAGVPCRFAAAAGWLSVAIFSLIAGKEYEYILPAVPLLMVPTGVILDAASRRVLEGWRAAVYRWWFRVATVLVPAGAIGIAVWIAVAEFQPVLMVEVGVCAAAAVALVAVPFFRGRTLALERIAFAAFVVCLSWLLTRSYYYTGDRSPKTVARLCRQLVEEGFTVEATRIFPQFAFYAQRTIPLNFDLPGIQERLQEDPRYVYLTREHFLPAREDLARRDTHVLIGPTGGKELVLLANERLQVKDRPQASRRATAKSGPPG